MDSITIKHKLYEKSILVAKRYGYTVDYLGQLARAGKIDSKLVGRSRYVHAPSVEEYQRQLAEQDKDIDKTNYTKKEDRKHLNAHSLQSKSDDSEAYSVPLHVIKESPGSSNGSNKRARHSVAKYYSDSEAELIPVIKKNQTDTSLESVFPRKVKTHPPRSRVISVSSSEGGKGKVGVDIDGREKPSTKDTDSNYAYKNSTPEKKLKIHSYSANFSIINPQLPKVRLRGKLTVGSGDVVSELNDGNRKEVRSIQNYFDDIDRNASRLVSKNLSTLSETTQNSNSSHKKIHQNSSDFTTTSSSTSFSYTPQSVRTSSVGNSQSNLYLLTAVIFLLFLAVGLIFVESQTVFIGESGLTATTWHFVLPWR